MTKNRARPVSNFYNCYPSQCPRAKSVSDTPAIVHPQPAEPGSRAATKNSAGAVSMFGGADLFTSSPSKKPATVKACPPSEDNDALLCANGAVVLLSYTFCKCLIPSRESVSVVQKARLYRSVTIGLCFLSTAGKLFRSRMLTEFIHLLLANAQFKPVDWLLDDWFYLRYCHPEKDYVSSYGHLV